MDAVVIEPPLFACVVAADADRGIGRGNDLPWPRLAGDVAHFKQITTATRNPGGHNAVIMGRKTWESIPAKYRPLPGRTNIVVSRSPRGYDGADQVAAGLEPALDAAVRLGAESIFVAGGGELYRLAVVHPKCEVVYYTRIDGQFAHDAEFPAFEHIYRLDGADPARTDAGITYSIQRWRRDRDI